MENTIFYQDFLSSSHTREFVETVSGECLCSYSSGEGLRLDNTKYTTTHQQGVLGREDNIKTQMLNRQNITMVRGEVICGVKVSSSQLFDRVQPIPKEFIPRVRCVYDDYRLCCFGLVMTSIDKSVRFMSLVTSTSIYGLYEKVGCYTYTFLLCRKEEMETVDIEIGVDSYTNSVHWYVNKVKLFTVPQIGRRIPDQHIVLNMNLNSGNTSIDIPTDYMCGFGHYTFLDHQMPNNYSRDKVKVDRSNDITSQYHIHRSHSGLVMLSTRESYLECYPDTYGRYHPIVESDTFAVISDSKRHRVFGQGNISEIKEMRIYTRKEPELTPMPSVKLKERSVVTFPRDEDKYIRNESSFTDIRSTLVADDGRLLDSLSTSYLPTYSHT